jgi:hypothetical protein
VKGKVKVSKITNLNEVVNYLKGIRKGIEDEVRQELRFARRLWAEAYPDDPELKEEIRDRGVMSIDPDGTSGTVSIADPNAQKAAAAKEGESGGGGTPGSGPYDIKPGLLRSTKAKVGKQGQRYIDVPLAGQGRYTRSAVGRFLLTALGREAVAPKFRRVSEQWQDKKGQMRGSKPSSWIHPGQKRKGKETVIERVQRDLNEDFERHLSKRIEQLAKS